MTLRRALSFLAGFLVVVLGTEVGVRALQSHLPQPRHYFSMPAETYVHSMNVLRAHGIRSDITFVGTSMVQRDIDANETEHLIPGVHWAHNVALPGAQTSIVRRWLLQEVLPRLHSRRVVWGISSLDFNSGRVDHPLDQYNAARATDPSFYGDLDRIMWNSAISDNRDTLRDPYKLFQALRGHVGAKAVDDRPLRYLATPRMGFPESTPARIAAFKRRHFAYARDTQLHHFTIGKTELAAYRNVLQTLRRDHLPIVVVIMPVTTLYLRAHPHGQSDYLRWKRTVTAVAAAEQVTVLDVSRTMPDSAFRDTEHLELPSARRFTRMLAARLRALGW